MPTDAEECEECNDMAWAKNKINYFLKIFENNQLNIGISDVTMDRKSAPLILYILKSIPAAILNSKKHSKANSLTKPVIEFQVLSSS